MAKKTAGDKSDKGSASADKNSGDKTPVEPPKNVQEPEILGKKFILNCLSSKTRLQFWIFPILPLICFLLLFIY